MLQTSPQIVSTQSLSPEMGGRFRFLVKPAVAPCWLCSSSGGRRVLALDMSKSFDTVNIHILTHKLHQTNIPHTIIKYIANYKAAKHTPHSETKHQHNANSKLVFHKGACYHTHSSTYTHLTLQHHRHQ